MNRGKWFGLGMLMLAPLVTSGYEAVPREALVGQWFNGAQNAKDYSGYTPSGTHDAFLTNVNVYAGFQSDAPSGFSGYSYYLLWNTLVVSNSATSDAGYLNTFDNTLSNQFAFTFWAKGALPSNWQPWASKGDMTAAGGGWHVRYTTDGIGRFTIYNGLTCDGAINTDTAGWHHYAAVWSKPDGGVRCLYQDGTLINCVTNVTAFITLPSGAHLCFGGYQKSTDKTFTGALGGTKLYDIRVYKQKLSQDQVKNIMTVAPVMSSCSLGAYGDATVSGTNITLQVDYANALTNIALSYAVSASGTGEPASGTAVDFSQGPVTYTLTSTNGFSKSYYVVKAERLPDPKKALVGRWVTSLANLRDYSEYTPYGTHDGVTTNGAVPFTQAAPPGFTGYSLDFSQSAGSVYIKNTITNDAGYVNTFDNTLSNQFTVAFWAKGIPSNWQAWVAKATEISPQSGYFFCRNGLSTNAIFRAVVNGSLQGTTSLSDVSDNNWHHFVGVWNRSTGVTRFFVDGVASVTTFTPDLDYTLCPHRYLVLGGQHKADVNGGINSGFDGLLYDVRIYKQIMFKDEVDKIRTVPNYPIPKGTMIRFY